MKDYVSLSIKNAFVAKLITGLGNLSTKNRVKDRFLAQNVDRLLDRVFRAEFQTGKQNKFLNRRQDSRQDMRQSF